MRRSRRELRRERATLRALTSSALALFGAAGKASADTAIDHVQTSYSYSTYSEDELESSKTIPNGPAPALRDLDAAGVARRPDHRLDGRPAAAHARDDERRQPVVRRPRRRQVADPGHERADDHGYAQRHPAARQLLHRRGTGRARRRLLGRERLHRDEHRLRRRAALQREEHHAVGRLRALDGRDQPDRRGHLPDPARAEEQAELQRLHRPLAGDEPPLHHAGQLHLQQCTSATCRIRTRRPRSSAPRRTCVGDFRPNMRQQFALLVRGNLHLEEIEATIHSSYQYYRDDWGISSHQFELSWYQTFGDSLQITPTVRYYSQTGSNFYVPVSQDPTGPRLRAARRLLERLPALARTARSRSALKGEYAFHTPWLARHRVARARLGRALPVERRPLDDERLRARAGPGQLHGLLARPLGRLLAAMLLGRYAFRAMGSPCELHLYGPSRAAHRRRRGGRARARSSGSSRSTRATARTACCRRSTGSAGDPDGRRGRRRDRAPARLRGDRARAERRPVRRHLGLAAPRLESALGPRARAGRDHGAARAGRLAPRPLGAAALRACRSPGWSSTSAAS